jgi:hypothetical protein
MEFQNILTNLSYAADDLIRYELLKKLSDKDILKLATLTKKTYISDILWRKILYDKCGGFCKEYTSIEDFNYYNRTSYNTWKDAIIDGFRLSVSDRIKRHMADLMWINFDINVIYGDSSLLVYISEMPDCVLNRLNKVLNDTYMGSILAKQHKYDEAYRYFSGYTSETSCNVNFDLLYTKQLIHDDVDNMSFVNKLKYGRFKYINEKVDRLDMWLLVKGIQCAIVREDNYDDIYNFLDRYNQLIRFDCIQFSDICEYTDNRQLLYKLLQYTDIDGHVIKWCMYDRELLSKLNEMVDIYIEDIVENDLIDISKLLDAGFKLRGDELVVDGYILYPPQNYDKEDFDSYYDYVRYMIGHSRDFVMNMTREYYIEEFVDDIVMLYRFDIMLIHALNFSNELMLRTNFRSEIYTNSPIYINYLNELKVLTERVNIKYFNNTIIDTTDYANSKIVETLLYCESVSIYKPMILLKALVKNQNIRDVLYNIEDVELYRLKSYACDIKTAYPLQYIGDIIGVNFSKVT